MTNPEGSQEGTKDGIYGAADHDEPYNFGRRPSTKASYPFLTRQLARLLIQRANVRDRVLWGTHPDGKAREPALTVTALVNEYITPQSQKLHDADLYHGPDNQYGGWCD